MGDFRGIWSLWERGRTVSQGGRPRSQWIWGVWSSDSGSGWRKMRSEM